MVVLWMISEQKNMQTNSIIQPPPLPYHLQSGNDLCTVDITLTRNITISSPNGDLLLLRVAYTKTPRVLLLQLGDTHRETNILLEQWAEDEA